VPVPGGGQTNTTAVTLESPVVAGRMFSRWRQGKWMFFIVSECNSNLPFFVGRSGTPSFIRPEKGRICEWLHLSNRLKAELQT
jgi:hypothetical protein